MIQRLSRYLNGLSFHRGLALGALVGAAIAGSTLWSKLRTMRLDDVPKATVRTRGGNSPGS